MTKRTPRPWRYVPSTSKRYYGVEVEGVVIGYVDYSRGDPLWRSRVGGRNTSRGHGWGYRLLEPEKSEYHWFWASGYTYRTRHEAAAALYARPQPQRDAERETT